MAINIWNLNYVNHKVSHVPVPNKGLTLHPL